MGNEFSVTVKGDHACLDKVSSPGKVIILPSFIDGLPLTELGRYALSGTDVEEVYLPVYLERIGAYAFYGCESLKVIHAFGRALDLGAGVFAGDRKIALIDLYEFPGEDSCLKVMLSEIRQVLRVHLHELSPGQYNAGQMKDLSYENAEVMPDLEARLIFPEYYEESIENTPARQLVYQMHGCGQRYRYSFINREFKFAEYDSLFPYVRAEEDAYVSSELAIGRLRFPRELGEAAREDYKAYLRGNWKAAAGILLDADECGSVTTTNLEPETLPWLFEDIIQPDDEQLSFITDLAQKKGDTAMVSFCMDYSHRDREDAQERGASPRKKRFELI